MCSRARSRSPVDASNHDASSSAVPRSSGGGGVAGGVERGHDPLRTAAVAEHDPGPPEAVDDGEREQRVVGRRHQASAASMLARSVRANARCSAWRLLRTPSVDEAAASGEPAGVRGEGSRREPGVGHGVEGERADAVEQPVAAVATRSGRRRRSRENGWRAGRRCRSPRETGPRARRGRTRPRRAMRLRRRWRAPTGHAGRRGTAGRSSTGSSPRVLAAVPACGSSGRAARRSDRRGGG